MSTLHREKTLFVRQKPRRDGKILSLHRQAGSVAVDTLHDFVFVVSSSLSRKFVFVFSDESDTPRDFD